jgi:glycosyltransferase involved in cell wall biosynthesis
MQVSVLMTVYNQAFETVRRAIDSVCKQNFEENYELIIIDDGSEEHLGQAILAYAHSLNLPIKYLKQANQGQAKALNYGIVCSAGKYIAILDADDEYLPEHLLKNWSFIQDNVLLYAEAYIISDTKDDYLVPDKYDVSQMVHIGDCVVMGTLFGLRKVFSKILFEEHRALDAIFYEKVAKAYPTKTAKMPFKTYLYYRNSPTSKTNIIKKMMEY